ncbi:MAG: VWA domain-containing protein [Muribaculaceae bacterium]|nr:VWA domain-containing protein [Muribaculaceae bacterium]
MKIIRLFLAAAILLGSIQNATGRKLWDMILLDVSSDMDAYAKNNVNEMLLAEQCIKNLDHDGIPDSIMFFAKGRVILPVNYFFDKKLEYSNIRKIIGDDTSINNALASCMAMTEKPNRILVITNGREGSNSISSNTLSKLMKCKGMRIDALLVSAGCDSIYMPSSFDPTDSHLYERTFISSGLKKIVERTGGKMASIDGESDIKHKIKEFESLVTEKNTRPSKVGCNLNPELTYRMLGRIKPQKIDICEVDTNAVIKYGGCEYHGLSDVLKVSDSTIDVLTDYESNHADSSGNALNIVFLAKPEERNRTQSILRNIKAGESYCKLRQNTPFEILPMIYYSGSGDKMLLCGLEYEVAVK